MNEDNKIFKTNEISIEISPVKNTVDSQRAQYYSYDENSGLQRIHILKDGQPLGLPEGSEIRLSAVKLSGSKQMMIYTPEIEDRVNGIVTFVIPKEFLGYSGQIRCTLYIDFSSDQTLHAGYFYINMGISDIDANLPEFSDSYWQRWKDFESEATTKMKELEAVLDVEAQRLTEHANQKITEYDQKFQQTAQNIATLDQNFNELRNDMKLSEAWAWSRDGVDRFTRKIYENLIVNSGNFKTLAPWSGGELDITTFPFPTIKGTGSLTQPENLTLKSDTEYVAIMRAYFTTEVEISSNFPFHMYVREEGGIPQSGRTYMEIVGGYRKAIPNTWETIIIKFKTIASDKKLTFKLHLYHNNWNGAERWLQNVMLVEGNEIPDFWVPNPADDKQNAYPQYRGLALLPSDLPEDYVWEESAERIKQLAQQETDKLKGEVADIQNWIRQQGGTI